MTGGAYRAGANPTHRHASSPPVRPQRLSLSPYKQYQIIYSPAPFRFLVTLVEQLQYIFALSFVSPRLPNMSNRLPSVPIALKGASHKSSPARGSPSSHHTKSASA